MSQSAQIVSLQLICMFTLLAKLIRTSSSMLMTTNAEIEVIRVCSIFQVLRHYRKNRKHKRRCSALDQLRWNASQRLNWQVACFHIAIWCSASGVGEGE